MKITYSFDYAKDKREYTIEEAVKFVLTDDSSYGALERLEEEVNELKEMMGRLINTVINNKHDLKYILGPTMDVEDD